MSSPLQGIVGGKYEIVRKIREGGAGVIYLVRHRLLEERMVIKVLRKQLAFEDEMMQRFLNEAKNAIRLHHANIARIHDFSADPDEGIAFIVMEYIDGVSLEDMLRGHGPASLPLTIEISRQFLGALGYLHDHGIVHRDVAADNIMLSRDEAGEPLVRLIDLGIAKSDSATTSLTTPGQYVGKIHYSSPEHFGSGDSDPEVEPRSDIYSFGVLLYRLLTGVFPIQGDSFHSLAGGHLFQEPVPFSESDPRGRVPEGLRRVVLRALAKEPADRVGSAAAFEAELAEFAEEGPYGAELDAVFDAVARRREELEARPEPGSTQEKIDAHFPPEHETAGGLATPPPGRPPTSGAVSPAALAEAKEQARAARTVEKAIQEGRFDDAERALRQGLKRHPDSEALAALGEELVDRRFEEVLAGQVRVEESISEPTEVDTSPPRDAARGSGAPNDAIPE